MASKLPLRALSMRVTTAARTPGPHTAQSITAVPIITGRRCLSLFGGGDKSPTKEEKKSSRLEAWIEELKALHGSRWQSVYDESRARQARNEELIRERHRQKKAAAPGAEDEGDAKERVKKAEAAWVAQLKARYGKEGWRAAYQHRNAAFEAGMAKSEQASEAFREKMRAEKEAWEVVARQAKLEAALRAGVEGSATPEGDGSGAGRSRAEVRRGREVASF